MTPNLTQADPVQRQLPLWIASAAGFGILWNAYGLFQFADSLRSTEADLIAGGMTQAQATVYLGLPAWVTLAFAVGVLCGLIGSLLILVRKRLALPVLAASLAGYTVLFAGDAGYGVFTSMPEQMAILIVVVLIAAVLFAFARHARSSGLLG